MSFFSRKAQSRPSQQTSTPPAASTQSGYYSNGWQASSYNAPQVSSSSALNGSPVNETDSPLMGYSTEFPPGYGDLQIISYDNVVFHFHKWLLAYMSPVLADMIRAGARHGHRQGVQELKLNDSSIELGELLRFVDPKMINPTLEHDTFTRLLEIGRKYEVTKLIDWIKTWVSDNLDEFFTPFNGNMYTALSLFNTARNFRFKKLAQGALRVLIRCPSVKLDPYIQVEMPPIYYRTLINIRHHRIKWFQEEIRAMIGRGAPCTLMSGDGLAINDTEYTEIIGTIMELAFAIGSEPSYACVERLWPQSFYMDYFHGSQAAMEELKEKARVLEAELPEVGYADWDP